MVKSNNKPAVKTRQNFFARAAKKVSNLRKKIALATTMAYIGLMMNASSTLSAYAASSSSTPATTDPDAMFDNVVGFFANWIGRIGLVVGFVGAIMFGLAIRSEDSDQKTRGLMTMASGFVVYAITRMLNLFGISVSII